MNIKETIETEVIGSYSERILVVYRGTQVYYDSISNLLENNKDITKYIVKDFYFEAGTGFIAECI